MAAVSTFRPRDAGMLIGLALLWGHSFLFVKTAVAALAPAWIVSFRMALGALVLVGVAVATRAPWPRERGVWLRMGALGVLGSGLPWVGQAWASRGLDSGLTAVLNATTPVSTLLLALALGLERPYRNRVFGLCLAGLGIALVVSSESRAGRSDAALAVAVVSTFGYAIAAVFTRTMVTGRVPTAWAAALQLGLGALVLAPCAYLLEGPPPSSLPGPAAASLVALAVLGTGVAFLLYFTLLARVGATNTSMVTFLVPAIGLTSGALVRGERIGPHVVVGAVAMGFGVWLSQRAPADQAPARAD